MTKTEIQQVFNEISGSTGLLLECLSEEFTAINDNQYSTLISLAEKKQSLVDQLNQLDARRSALSSDTTEFQNLLAQLDPSKQLSNQWNITREQIKQCQHQNEINGRLLNRRNHIARETMAILTGHNTANESTYGSDGVKHGGGSMLPDVQA
ncbi:MAG: flagellar protein FlgN [Gammaproteobacteria bacterium]|nr:flagellar protein FlgN [Gammaproteobacteria bacterium]